jgi:hypothetical protein
MTLPSNYFWYSTNPDLVVLLGAREGFDQSAVSMHDLQAGIAGKLTRDFVGDAYADATVPALLRRRRPALGRRIRQLTTSFGGLALARQPVRA